MAPYLTAINEATRLNLLVVAATCYGADIATLIQPLEPARFRVVIGPNLGLSFGEIETGTIEFYRTLFRERDGGLASIAMNLETKGKFFLFTAEWLFLQILKEYYNEHTTEEQIVARAERYIAPLALLRVSPAEMARRRHVMHAALRDRKAVFDQSYLKFFFVDRYPELADRFRMTFEGCFEPVSNHGPASTVR